MVKGNGKRVIAVFEDPELRVLQALPSNAARDVDNVTVYTFLYNILSPDSDVKSQERLVLCRPRQGMGRLDAERQDCRRAREACSHQHADEKIMAARAQAERHRHADHLLHRWLAPSRVRSMPRGWKSKLSAVRG